MQRLLRPLLAPGLLSLASLASLALAGCSDDPGTEPASAPADILEQLQAIEGLAAVEEQPPQIEGYRSFVLTIEQPADHGDPGGPTFQQRLNLLHRDASAPLVLATTGYSLPGRQRLGEPARLLQANQLYLEHRFFTPSRPEPADWSLLDIEQAAGDQHRIAEAFRPLYSGAWIGTGGSKGGMASVYHRRFHPDDVDATVAYVAPHTLALADAHFLDFVDQLGEADCRQALRDAQREVLLRRPAMLERMQAQAEGDGLTYEALGMDRALEIAAVEMVFTFWQYSDASRCPDVPAAASTDDEVFAFLDEIVSPSFWSDAGYLAYEPYYWQAGTQLGYPALDEANVADLLLYPGLDVPATFVEPGPGKEMSYSSAAMEDVSAWLDAEGERMLFIYGENDPYSATPFELGQARDSYRFFVPGGNHGSRILDLQEADRDAALGALEAWTGVTPVLPVAGTREAREPVERWPR